jgi:hypothetical protein
MTQHGIWVCAGRGLTDADAKADADADCRQEDDAVQKKRCKVQAYTHVTYSHAMQHRQIKPRRNIFDQRRLNLGRTAHLFSAMQSICGRVGQITAPLQPLSSFY